MSESKESKEFPDWLLRLRDEEANCRTRVQKLEEFFQSETFRNLDASRRALLYRQRKVMADYLTVLSQRLNLEIEALST